MKRNRERNKKIDFIRGVLIILMVMGHAYAPGSHLAALFNMPVFFMISGYLFNPTSVKGKCDLIKYYLRKVKTLWRTYFLWNTVFVLLNNVFIKTHIYTDNSELETAYGIYNSLNHYMSLKEMVIAIAKGLLMLGGGTKIGGAFWFLTVLFGVSIAYAAMQHLLMQNDFCDQHYMKIQGIIALLLLGIGYGLQKMENMIYGISPCFSVYILFYIGNCLSFLHKKYDDKKWYFPRTAIAVICYGGLLCLNHMGSINLGKNNYEKPLFLLSASLAGWFMLYEISNFFAETKLAKVIEVAGENSLIIMIFHFLSFKLVNMTGILLEQKPFYLVAAFPVLYDDGVWWILYTAVGVGMPVLVNNMIKKVRGKCVAGIKEQE